MQKSLQQVMLEKILLLDGGMGSQILANSPTVEDFGGTEFEGCLELLNERRPNWISGIHEAYFKAGADAVETNSFGANPVVLADFGLAERAYEINKKAAALALNVASSFNYQKFVIGSIGPGTKLVTLGQVGRQALFASYLEQCKGLIDGGAHALLIETAQDIAQIKIAVRAAHEAIKTTGKRVQVWTQFTIESNGAMLVGSDVQAAYTALEPLNIDVIGMNCATGPAEMRSHMSWLCGASKHFVSCLPNAGMPLNENGVTRYPLSPKQFAKQTSDMAFEFGINILGGCCGTTPDHIRELHAIIENRAPTPRKPQFERHVSSLFSAVPIAQEPRPLLIGERTNANGSKAFKDKLLSEDWDAMVEIAKSQAREGAHVLDVSVASVGRNESRDMELFLQALVRQVNLPIMIDTTEINVVEQALLTAPGRCIVNSIHFEDGETRARKVLALCKEHGAAVVGLCIDEKGMARTVAEKVAISERLYNLVTKEFAMNPGDLLIDPLTFTLATGNANDRNSAVETLAAIKAIKEACPGVKTVLGLSNVSFGLEPKSRRILNSLLLAHALENGLDAAILHASKILPLSRIAQSDKDVFEDLLLNRTHRFADPLKEILSRTVTTSTNSISTSANLSIEEKMRNAIIEGDKSGVAEIVNTALSDYSALDIINKFLLDAMRIVGERFGSGEMQLPFVLESAETMKTAVRALEPHIPKTADNSRGTILLATVRGDVHDIGKNLVDIILTNNGYTVKNIGIKQSIDSILEVFEKEGANAIGLSGLLVKSTAIMKENLEVLSQRGITVPVLLGGAALTQEYVERDCRAVYNGSVFYAKDAFAGLNIMDTLREANFDHAKAKLLAPVAKTFAQESDASPTETIRVVRRGNSQTALDKNGQSAWVRKNEFIPSTPWLGTRVFEKPISEVFNYLDDFALIRGRWAFAQGSLSNEAFEKIIKERAEPLLHSLKKRIIENNLLQPKMIVGFFPACSSGNCVIVYSPETCASTPPSNRKVLARFEFPRQQTGRRLCISDFLRHENSGELDVLAAQVVTVGESASAIGKSAFENDNYSDYFYFHALSTELAEACAEIMHKEIRTLWKIDQRDSPSMREVFSQGYQGSRYSFGYPACPDLAASQQLLNLLDAKRIGISLTESFQMVPEQSTSALVMWHPQARYFSVL